MYLWQVGQFAKWWDIPQAFWGEREWQSESITISCEVCSHAHWLRWFLKLLQSDNLNYVLHYWATDNEASVIFSRVPRVQYSKQIVVLTVKQLLELTNWEQETDHFNNSKVQNLMLQNQKNISDVQIGMKYYMTLYE